MKTTTKDHLRSALTKVAEIIGQFASAADADIERVEAALSQAQAGAAKKPLTGAITIPTSGWGSDTTATYPKYYDIAVTGVTTSDRASVDIAQAALATAVACGLCPVTETLAGKIRLRAASIPAAAMAANYWVERGA